MYFTQDGWNNGALNGPTVFNRLIVKMLFFFFSMQTQCQGWHVCSSASTAVYGALKSVSNFSTEMLTLKLVRECNMYTLIDRDPYFSHI